MRLQCSPPGTYAGPIDALKSCIRQEGLRAIYKGATPPLIGWTISDSMLMGSLHQYRLLIAAYETKARSGWRDDGEGLSKRGVKEEPLALSLKGHWAAGLLAGLTVCFVAAPTEHLKARLQVRFFPFLPSFLLSRLTHSSTQMQTVGPKLYSGPIDCARQIVKLKGVRGLWHGFGATLIFRSWMGVMCVLSPPRRLDDLY